MNLVQAAPKGQLSVILLLNTHDSTHSKPLAGQSFWRTMKAIPLHMSKCAFSATELTLRFWAAFSLSARTLTMKKGTAVSR